MIIFADPTCARTFLRANATPKRWEPPATGELPKLREEELASLRLRRLPITRARQIVHGITSGMRILECAYTIGISLSLAYKITSALGGKKVILKKRGLL